MGYAKTVWVNGVAPAINNTNLNKMEQELYDLDIAALVGRYVVDASEADQGLTGNGKSVKAYIDSIGTSKKATLLFLHTGAGNTTTYTFSTSETITSNITCVFLPGAIADIGAGKTLTINGPFECGLHQAFSGSGTVSFGSGVVKEVFPQWWTTNTTPGTTDMASAINNAFLSLPGNGGTVVINELMGVGSASWTGLTIDMKTNISLIGSGKNAALKLLALPTQAPTGSPGQVTMLLVKDSTFIQIRDLELDGNSLAATLITNDSSDDCIIDNNYLHDTSGSVRNGVYTEGGQRNKYINNIVTNCDRGLWIGNTPAGSIEIECIIESNICYSNRATGIGGTQEKSIITNNISNDNTTSGIALGTTSTGVFQEVTVSGNVLKGNGAHGIQSDGVSPDVTIGISVVGNICEENDGSGIYAVNVEEWIINGNYCRNNNHDASGTGHGIILDHAKNIVVSGNICSDTRAGASRTQNSGILVQGSTIGIIETAILNNNVCYNNLQYGIVVQNQTPHTVDKVVISGNQTNDNGHTGLNVVDAAVGEVTNCVITGNISEGNTTADFRNDPVDSVIENNIFVVTTANNMIPALADDATPSVKNGKMFRTGGTTTITDFDDGTQMQIITIIAEHTITITDGTNIFLNGSVNFDMIATDTLTLVCKIDGLWYELGRSDNT